MRLLLITQILPPFAEVTGLVDVVVVFETVCCVAAVLGSPDDEEVDSVTLIDALLFQ